MKRHTARVRDLALRAAAIVGALCLLATVACAVSGVRPLVFRSGSMSPTIDTGALALARRVPASALEVGDVVTVPSGEGNLVTHRIVDVAHGDGVAQLRLKGDANRTPDPQPYTVDHAERVFASVPWLGYLVGWATGKVGLFVLGLYAMALLGVVLRPDRGSPSSGDDDHGRRRGGRARHRRPPTPTRGRHRSTRAPVMLAVATVATVAVAAVAPTTAQAAPWADPVGVSGATLTSSVIPAPATFFCNGTGLLSVTFGWSSVSGATGYTLHYGSGGSQTVDVGGTSATVTAVISGGTAWIATKMGTWTSAGSTQTRSYSIVALGTCS